MTRRIAVFVVVFAVVAGVGAGWAVKKFTTDAKPEPTVVTTTPPPPSVSAPPSASPTPTAPPVDHLDNANLITASQLDPLPDPNSGAWKEYPQPSMATLPCQADWLRTLGPAEKLTGEFQSIYPESGQVAAATNTAVLRFATEAKAAAAYETLTGWISDCNDPLGFTSNPPTVNRVKNVAVTGGSGLRSDVSYLAPEACDGECDAAWFSSQVVALIGDRIAMISYVELAGPQPPDDEARVSTAVTAVLAAARR